ncbi:MAG: hypothetical protein ABJG68_09030 [Crocinitomicaceae bacterium]
MDKIGQKDAVKVSGGINFNTITYAQSGLFAPSREPFTWFASGNINVSILDVALPFTYTYSNQGGKFTQPFNRTAIHPQYKWFKSHIGVVSMSFSPYTMSGQLFLGGGVELTPGKWNIQLMGGRLRKAVDYDPIENNLNSISYKRWGYGLKVGYENKGFGGEVILFKGNDDPSSLNVIPFSSTIKPQDNLVISFKGKAQLTKKVNATAEYAISGLTQNSTEINDLNPAMQHIFHKILNGNATTDFFNAFNTSINYASDKMNLAFKFEHIDPGYKTLGGYYFNQDLQNFTLAPSFTLFKKKVNIALNTGFQRNNLSTLESSTTNRWIGSANVTFVPGKKLVLTTTYSNFSTFTRNRPTIDPFYYQPADTLNFYQLSQNASAMVSYTLGDGDIKNVLQLVYNYQESTNLSGNISQGGVFGLGMQTSAIGVPTHVHMANLAYSAQFSKISANFTIAANVNQTYILDQNSTFIGPTVNFQKSLFEKKANLGLGTTYNRQYSNADLTSNILNHRVSFGISPKFKNEKIGQVSISANANLMQRFAIATNQVNVHEMNVYVNLSYSF